jgi:hypothetical protein
VTTAGGRPKSAVGWLNSPFAHSQCATARAKPGACCSVITARPGETSTASSVDTALNLLPAWVIWR